MVSLPCRCSTSCAGRPARSGPRRSGTSGPCFSGQGIELVWVSKLGERVDENWFSSDEIDLILVIQGQLKFEFESPGEPDRVIGVGEIVVLPAGARCRAYRWPRDSREAAVFVAAHPTEQGRPAPAHG